MIGLTVVAVGTSMPESGTPVVAELSKRCDVAFARTGFRIARWEGAALLAGYLVYVCVTWP